MKFRKYGQVVLASVVSLGLVTGITACGISNTVDYVYVTNSKANPGQINVYYLDYESGALTELPNSPYPSGGRNPVAEVTSPNGKNLYVVNHDDNTIVQFAIGTDAKLYASHTYNTPGTEPNAISISSQGNFLFVTDTYEPGFTSANPGSGALVVYPVNTDGSLGTPVANGNLAYWPLNNDANVIENPVGVTVLQNGNFVYVANQSTTTGLGSISAFGVGSGGVLTPIYCTSGSSTCESDGTYLAGTAPSGIASDPTDRFVYVTDSFANQLISYTVQSAGIILPSQNGPTRTDVFPKAVVVDPRGQYVYVANYTANDVSAYTINQSTGYPTGVAAAGTYGTDTGPNWIFIEPALGRYVYTANFLGNTVSGFLLNPNTGVLQVTQNSPYKAAGQPTAVAAVPHGNHATQNLPSY